MLCKHPVNKFLLFIFQMLYFCFRNSEYSLYAFVKSSQSVCLSKVDSKEVASPGKPNPNSVAAEKKKNYSLYL